MILEEITALIYRSKERVNSTLLTFNKDSSILLQDNAFKTKDAMLHIIMSICHLEKELQNAFDIEIDPKRASAIPHGSVSTQEVMGLWSSIRVYRSVAHV
ncbi:hypothetical protein L596_002605 [Steinernema carpocapsae]|uniref:Uncharacterized protein n=1 Tax=Steinernema carpocapsae TaxID=34508 RepID=A0A4U8URJ8_STECR|nr:hypothetical protein L596_002605 [Steinernema carpocapsae]